MCTKNPDLGCMNALRVVFESERRESVIFYVMDLFDSGISWVILLIK
jgi:hypothetical protein